MIPARFQRHAAALRPFLFYALSIAFGKGLSLVTLPYLAHHLSPAEFVRLDIAASIIEPVGLFAAFALADTLFRFGQGDEANRRAVLGRLIGTAFVLAAALIALTQLVLIPALSGMANLPSSPAMRAILASACLGGVIELPLAFLRLSGRPGLFLGFVAGRASLQALSLVGLLATGLGVDAILLGNAAIDVALVAGLLLTLPKGTRIHIDRAMIGKALRYAGPILLGAFAMFALGSCDRWFLTGTVSPQDLAHYALAAKLSLALALATQPFALWWYPRRLGVLDGARGVEETARFWAMGVLTIGAGAILTMVAARLLVLFLMPGAYSGALTLLPAMLAIVALNELSSVSNGVAYAQASGWRVLRTNGAGALVAVALYIALIPTLGLTGAIVATLAGQALRLTLFLADRHRGTRIPYPLFSALAFLAASMLLIVQFSGRAIPDLSVIGLILSTVLVSAILLASYHKAAGPLETVP